jgi:hypothetical protein
MNTLMLSNHAAARMAQRSIKLKDAELLALIGTEVDDGYLVLAKDCQQVERVLKSLIERAWRVCGKRLVVADGQIVTVYHASPKYHRRLLRTAHDRDLCE